MSTLYGNAQSPEGLSTGSNGAPGAATKQPQEKLLIPAAQAAEMLSMGRSTFWNKVKLHQLPQPVKVAGLTRWRVADLRRFVEIAV